MLPARVNLVLNSYEDFRDSPGPVIEWVEQVRSSVADPLASQAVAAGHDLRPRLIARFRDSDRLTRRKLTDGNWETMKGRLRNGELDTLWVEYAPDLAFEIEADLDPVTGGRYSLFVETRRLPDGVTPELQAALVGVLQLGAQLLRAATGYLTVDVFPCPYEAVMRCEEDNWQRYEEQVRGYYWGNILSEHHLAQLGGLADVLREAPFFVAQDVSTADHQLVYLQSTERLDDWPPAAIAAARTFVAPLLPGGAFDAGNAEKATHVIEDGPRAERPAVPGTRYWQWLQIARSRVAATPPLPDLDGLQAEAEALSPGPRRSIPQEVTDELFLDLLEVTVVFSDPPPSDVRSDLIRLIEVWAAQGVHGSFGGVMHSVDRPSYLETDEGATILGLLADLGSAGRSALDVLIERLERFIGARDVAVDRIILGHGGADTPSGPLPTDP